MFVSLGLAPGVYRVQQGELPDRILVIDHEPGSNMTPPAIIANVSVTQPNSTETTSQMPTIAGVCSLITGTSTTTSSGQVNKCARFMISAAQVVQNASKSSSVIIPKARNQSYMMMANLRCMQ